MSLCSMWAATMLITDANNRASFALRRLELCHRRALGLRKYLCAYQTLEQVPSPVMRRLVPLHDAQLGTSAVRTGPASIKWHPPPLPTGFASILPRRIVGAQCPQSGIRENPEHRRRNGTTHRTPTVATARDLGRTARSADASLPMDWQPHRPTAEIISAYRALFNGETHPTILLCF